MNKITCDQCVNALKEIGVSAPAKEVAARLGVTSRAVATALREATKDGRVYWTFPNGSSVAHYRFLRAMPSDATAPQAKQGEQANG